MPVFLFSSYECLISFFFSLYCIYPSRYVSVSPLFSSFPFPSLFFAFVMAISPVIPASEWARARTCARGRSSRECVKRLGLIKVLLQVKAASSCPSHYLPGNGAGN